jgi:hypothetical protein
MNVESSVLSPQVYRQHLALTHSPRLESSLLIRRNLATQRSLYRPQPLAIEWRSR